MSARSVRELARVPFSGRLEVAFDSYSKEAEALAIRLRFELEAAAGDAEAAMRSLKGKWWLVGMDTRHSARKVAKRLKRAAELADGVRGEARAFSRSYHVAFVLPARARAKAIERQRRG